MKIINFLKPYFIKRIPLMLLSFLIAWVLHTYLLVAINQGYWWKMFPGGFGRRDFSKKCGMKARAK